MAPVRNGDPETTVRAAIARLCPAGPLGVAVSGGGDSMALLAIAHRTDRTVAAATVDHGLRPAAAAEARMVAAFCGRHGIAHNVLQATGLADEGPGNLPARAREARYGLLSNWARDRGLATVLLGHTLDDQAETVLMRLARGSGVDGLSAMAERLDRDGIRWIRPMLSVHRADLRRWLTEQGIAWTEDPTNEDQAYDRVRMREALALLAPLGITAEGLAETATRLRRQRDVLEAAGRDLIRRACRAGPLGEILIDRAAFASALPETGLRVLAGALMEIAGARYRPRFRALEPLYEALIGTKPCSATLGGCVIRTEGEEIVICREPAATQATALRPVRTEWDNGWIVTAPPGISGDLRIAALCADGLEGATRAMRQQGITPPAEWVRALPAVRQAAPAVWRGTDPQRGNLVALPSAGLVLEQQLAGIGAHPPDHRLWLQHDTSDKVGLRT